MERDRERERERETLTDRGVTLHYITYDYIVFLDDLIVFLTFEMLWQIFHGNEAH